MTDVHVDEFDFSESEGDEVAKNARPVSASFDRVEFLRLDASPAGIAAGKDKVLIRLLSDHARLEGQPELPAWITVDQHSFVPTKPKPKDMEAGRSWPSSMSAVCRNDKVFAKRYGDCYICAQKMTDSRGRKATPYPQQWAIAVEREEVIGDGTEALGGPSMQGQVVGIRDKMKEVVVTDANGDPLKGPDGKATGETKMAKSYLKINQGWKNFFGPLSGLSAYFGGTLLARDFLVIRIGTETDTTYQFIAKDEIHLPDGRTYDMRDKALREERYPDMPSLRAEIAAQASDEHYQRWFIPGEAPARSAKTATPQAQAAQGKAENTAAQAPAAPSSEPTSDRLAQLRARVSGGSPEPSAPASEAPAEESAPAPAQSAPTGGRAF